MDCSPPGSSISGIFQARVLEWVAISFSNVWNEKWKWSHLVVSNSQRPHGLQPTRLLRTWDFPGKCTLGPYKTKQNKTKQKKKRENFTTVFNILEDTKWEIFRSSEPFYSGRLKISSCGNSMETEPERDNGHIFLSFFVFNAHPVSPLSRPYLTF